MNKQAVILSAVMFVGLCGSAGRLVYGGAKQNFVQVAFIPEGGYPSRLAAYDTDHDGLEELLLSGDTSVWLYEHMGDNQYEAVLELPGRVSWAAGDIDQDGLSDIVVQSYDSLEVFESPAPDSHPDHCVWRQAARFIGNPIPTWITDLDQDGRRELLVVEMGRWIYVLENTADNTYTQVFTDSVWSPYGPVGLICSDDFDGDGKTEFATSDGDGCVLVYENAGVGVDSFAVSWIDSLPILNAYAVAAGNDMDQDDKPEFVIGGTRNPGGWHKYIYTLFESTGDNVFEQVWADSSLTGGIFDRHRVACGDVDGDSTDEMIFGLDGYGISLYKCNGPDSYERIWEWYTGQRISVVFVYDLNKNGYGEIVVCAENGTWIFERELPGIEEEEPQLPMTDVGLMQNVPNPFGQKTLIRYGLAAPGPVSLRIYDRAGQLVRTLVHGFEQAGLKNVVWDGRDDRGERVGSGVYFYRLVAADLTGTRKLVILK